MNKYFFILLIIFCAVRTSAQSPDQRSYGQWLMYFGDNKINDQWGIHSELQLRNYFLKSNIEQTLIRVGANYYLGRLSMVTAGYAFIYTTPTEGNETGSELVENRIWEQLILRHRTYNVFLEHRYRIEQRFIENRTIDDRFLDHRIRYRFMALFPFYNISPSLRHYFIATYNEIFINMGRDTPAEYFDRNRFYVAVGYQVNPKFNLQVGYLHEVIRAPNRIEPFLTHNLQLSVSFNMDDLGTLFTTQKQVD